MPGISADHIFVHGLAIQEPHETGPIYITHGICAETQELSWFPEWKDSVTRPGISFVRWKLPVQPPAR